MSLDTRWEQIDSLLTRSSRTKDEKRTEAVQKVAEMRFTFPTKEHASYRTHVNVPTVTMTIQVGRDTVAPDIVTVERLNTGDTRLVMTAAVTIPEQVNEAEAKAVWSRYAAIPDQAFYLYVPVGYGAQAKKICRQLKIKVEGFRTWRTTPRGFEINEISEAPNPLSALMPPIVRKLLATP
ncbi:MAG: hypothetical protein M3P30_12360 [Chloroflexota bacterium]|nr:hypothetical protein [Chloroflexota bacterium]